MQVINFFTFILCHFITKIVYTYHLCFETSKVNFFKCLYSCTIFSERELVIYIDSIGLISSLLSYWSRLKNVLNFVS